MGVLAKDFAYGKWALVVLSLYVVATFMDVTLLHSTLADKLGAGPDVTSHILSEVANLSFFNFAAGAMFGALAGIYFHRRKLRKGE